jgi:hypothetical protein
MRQGKLAGVVTYVLKKDNVPEPTDKKAFNGNGYLSFFIPGGVPTKPDDYVSASQTIHPDGSGKYGLSFRTMDEGPNVLGYHFKQVLVDNEVVWEQDVGKNTVNNQWEEVTLDLTPYLTGKTAATLTLRLYEKKGVNNYWDNAGFDTLQPAGFDLANGDFEYKSDWQIINNYHGLIGDILIYDPNRQQNAFSAVKTSYLTYSLYDDIVKSDIQTGIKNSLSNKINQVLDDYFSEQNEKAKQELNALSNHIRAQAGKHIPQDQADLWESKIALLLQLY